MSSYSIVNLRQKLGKKLINYAVELCKNNGCYRLILDYSNENVKFYEKCNFQHKGNEMSLYFLISGTQHCIA